MQILLLAPPQGYLKWRLFLNKLVVRIKFTLHIPRKKKHNIKNVKSLCRNSTHIPVW